MCTGINLMCMSVTAAATLAAGVDVSLF